METIYTLVKYGKNDFTGHEEIKLIGKVTTDFQTVMQSFYEVIADMNIKPVTVITRPNVVTAAKMNTANGYKGYCVIKKDVDLKKIIQEEL